MPTGWRSVYLIVGQSLSVSDACGGVGPYLEVISKVVPKIWARTNSAMLSVDGS